MKIYRCLLWSAVTVVIVHTTALLLAGSAFARALIDPASKLCLLLSFPLLFCSIPFAISNLRLALIGFMLALLCGLAGTYSPVFSD